MAGFRVWPLVEGSGYPSELAGAVVAIGNFDGVHRGHQAVLSEALDAARKAGRPAVALTFEPHPRAVFRPEETLPRITPSTMKANLLRLLGFDAMVEQPFSLEFAGLDAETFVTAILIGRMQVSHVVTGFDFHFGRGRQGNPDFLADAGRRLGFRVTRVEAARDEGGAVLSSSRIRSLLAEGDVAQAAGLLGYRYTIAGSVEHGQKLGRTLGYPTANMTLPDHGIPAHGIYAVRLRRPDGSLHDGVASYGRRPTVVESGAPLLETYLFDFHGDLYWESCDVSFFGYLRGEEKFDGLDALKDRMRLDEEEARALLAGVRPISPLDLAVAF